VSLLSSLELNRQLEANFKKGISILVTKFLKVPAASAGPADSRAGLRFLVTSPVGNWRGGGIILEWAPSWRFSSRPLSSAFLKPLANDFEEPDTF